MKFCFSANSVLYYHYSVTTELCLCFGECALGILLTVKAINVFLPINLKFM